MCIGNVAVKLELRQTGVVRGAFSTSHATSHGAFEPLEAPLKLQVTSKVSGFHVSQQLLACVLPSHCHVEGRLLATEFNNISIRKPMSMDLTGARSPLGSKIYVSALLPLIRSENCDDHADSALSDDFLFAAVTPLSISARTLGDARAGFEAAFGSIIMPG